jgi:hypothetical protein
MIFQLLESLGIKYNPDCDLEVALGLLAKHYQNAFPFERIFEDDFYPEMIEYTHKLDGAEVSLMLSKIREVEYGSNYSIYKSEWVFMYESSKRYMFGSADIACKCYVGTGCIIPIISDSKVSVEQDRVNIKSGARVII